MEKYWEKEYNDIFEGVTFKFKKLNPVQHLGLVTQNIDFEKTDGINAEGLIKKCLEYTLWSKDKLTYSTLIDANCNATLPEMETSPAIGLDLFFKFRTDILMPVFTESKTCQNLLTLQELQEMKELSQSSQEE